MAQYQYNAEVLTFDDDFTTRTATEVGPDEFTTVEELDVDDGESIELGQGQSSNPLQAEGSVSGDIQDGGNADIDGKFRLVVLNPQNNVVQRIAQGSIDRLELSRSNSLDGYILPRSNVEVKEPYKIGFQLRTRSGTSTYSGSNSSLDIDAVRGEVVG